MVKQFCVMNKSINTYRYLCAKDSENTLVLPPWYVNEDSALNRNAAIFICNFYSPVIRKEKASEEELM